MGGVQRIAQAVEIAIEPSREARIGLQAEAHADKALVGHVEGVAGRQVVTGGVLGAVQRGPRDVRARLHGGCLAVALCIGGGGVDIAERRAADVGGKDRVGQVEAIQQVLVVAHLHRAHVEAHVGRVDIGEALQRHAVGGAVAGIEIARTADADGDVVLDTALDQIAVRFGDALAIRVGDADVIQTQREVARVENRTDMRGVQHLPAGRLGLKHARARQLHDRAGLEAGAVDVQRHPAMRAVAHAAAVGRHLRDRQGQQIRAQRGGYLVAAARAHQDVVIAGLRAGDHHLLVAGSGIAVRRVVGKRGGHVAVADVQLVVAAGLLRIEHHAQGLSRRHADLVQLRIAAGERGLQGAGHGQCGHLHQDACGRRRERFRRAGFFVDVRAHDDAPAAVLQRRQLRGERATVTAVGGHVAVVQHLAQ